MFAVPERQEKMQAGAGHGNCRWFPSPFPAPPSLQLLSQQLHGRVQEEQQPLAQQKGEALLVTVSSRASRTSTALWRSCNMKSVLCCDEQVTLKEQGAGVSPLITCQCHQREFNQGHSFVSGRDGTARDLSSLLLMKVASVTAVESWSHGRGVQEANV